MPWYNTRQMKSNGYLSGVDVPADGGATTGMNEFKRAKPTAG